MDEDAEMGEFDEIEEVIIEVEAPDTIDLSGKIFDSNHETFEIEHVICKEEKFDNSEVTESESCLYEPDTLIDEDDSNEEKDLKIVPFWEPASSTNVSDGAEETNFQKQSCCSHNCVKKFTLEDLKTSRAQCAKLDYRENGTNKLDSMLMLKLKSIVNKENKVKHARKSICTDRQRLKVHFSMHGKPICRKLFLFFHGIKNSRFDRLMHVYKTEGAVEKPHGNCGRIPYNRTALADSQMVVTFLKNYADQYALFMPARIAAKYTILKVLPPGCTKKNIYSDYKLACDTSGSVRVSLIMLRRLWSKFCSDIVVLRPISNSCAFCQRYFTSQKNFALKTGEEKTSFLRDTQNNLPEEEEERITYCATIEETRKALNTFLKLPLDSNNVDSVRPKIHLIFDLVQQIHIPFYSQQQTGPLTSLIPYKVGIFSIMNDTTKRQCNFLLPETAQMIKVENEIVSFLYNFIENYIEGAPDLEIHANNCTVQNENIVAFLSWLVMARHYSNIKYNFLAIDHTKLTCDTAFNLFKKILKCTDVPKDVINIFVESPAESNLSFVIPSGAEQGMKNTKVFDWCKFFMQNGLKNVPMITSYSHFTFNSEYPGAVRLQTSIADEGVLHQLFPAEIHCDGLYSLSNLNQIHPADSSETVREYVYGHIQQIIGDYSKELVVPELLAYLIVEAGASVFVGHEQTVDLLNGTQVIDSNNHGSSRNVLAGDADCSLQVKKKKSRHSSKTEATRENYNSG